MKRICVMATVLSTVLATVPPALAQQAQRGAQTPGPVLAQQAQRSPSPQRRPSPPPAPPKPEEPPPPPPEPPAAPYERDLLRLAEIIGSLAFLRTLCRAPDAGEWPQRMQALLDTEGATSNRRERLAGAYNRGYRGFALTYRVCTPSADLAVSRYLQEGEKLSRAIAGRFGG